MRFALIAAFILYLIPVALSGGCASPGAAKSPAAIVAPAGTDIDKANAYVGSAETAVQAAIPHTDAAGKEDLGLASSAHKSATTSLNQAKMDLVAAESDIAAKDKSLSVLTAQNATLLSAWGHKFQMCVTAAFWVLVVLVGVHLIGGVLGIFLPLPYGSVLALVAKIVNPLGWFSWLLTHVYPPVPVAPLPGVSHVGS